MSLDPFCLARRRPWVNIWNGESLKGFSESVSAFLRVGMEESVQNVTSPPSTRTHSSTMVCQVDGEKDVGRAELCTLVLSLLCARIILYLRLDVCLETVKQDHPSTTGEVFRTQTLPCWGSFWNSSHHILCLTSSLSSESRSWPPSLGNVASGETDTSPICGFINFGSRSWEFSESGPPARGIYNQTWSSH